jgi:hypothetical protein
METLAAWIAPLQQRVNERTAYVGYLTALAAYFIALYLPWSCVPVVVEGHGGLSANGWDELAYLPALPYASVLLNGLRGRRALKLNVIGLCIMLAFAVLLVDNVEHRSMWLTPLLVDAGGGAPHALYGSALGAGFWVATASMIALSVFSLVWTMHVSGETDVVEQREGLLL